MNMKEFKKWWSFSDRIYRLRREETKSIDRAVEAKRACEHWSLCSATETNKERSNKYYERAEYYRKTYMVQRSRAFRAANFLAKKGTRYDVRRGKVNG